MGNGIWEDEDSRQFYESILDLKNAVPAIVLEGKRGKKDASTSDTTSTSTTTVNGGTSAQEEQETSTAKDNNQIETAMREMIERMGLNEDEAGGEAMDVTDESGKTADGPNKAQESNTDGTTAVTSKTTSEETYGQVGEFDSTSAHVEQS
jgi:hypothetical protein